MIGEPGDLLAGGPEGDARRAKLAQQIGHEKNGSAVLRPEREAQVLERMVRTNPGPLPSGSVTPAKKCAFTNVGIRFWDGEHESYQMEGLSK